MAAVGGGKASLHQATGLGEGVLAGASDPRGLHGGRPHRPEPSGGGCALPRHPRRRREGCGGCRVVLRKPPPTICLDSIMSWTPNSISIFNPSHQSPLRRGLSWGLGETEKRKLGVGRF